MMTKRTASIMTTCEVLTTSRPFPTKQISVRNSCLLIQNPSWHIPNSFMMCFTSWIIFSLAAGHTGNFSSVDPKSVSPPMAPQCEKPKFLFGCYAYLFAHLTRMFLGALNRTYFMDFLSPPALLGSFVENIFRALQTMFAWTPTIAFVGCSFQVLPVCQFLKAVKILLFKKKSMLEQGWPHSASMLIQHPESN
jgi:hypothetical protein